MTLTDEQTRQAIRFQAIRFLSISNRALAEANTEMVKMIEGLRIANDLMAKGNQELTEAMKLLFEEIKNMEDRLSALESMTDPVDPARYV